MKLGQNRRAYTTADLRTIRAHYRDCTVTELAHLLGRTVGSVKRFIQARPELHKRSLLQAAWAVPMAHTERHS